MGIRDTNPVTGVYRGWARAEIVAHAVSPDFESGNFELTYTSGATGGQLDFTVNLRFPYPNQPLRSYTWADVSVDNEGYFDNGITANNNRVGANKLEGSFYQGGEVGGVFSYRTGQEGRGLHRDGRLFWGGFGGKLVPDTP